MATAGPDAKARPWGLSLASAAHRASPIGELGEELRRTGELFVARVRVVIYTALSVANQMDLLDRQVGATDLAARTAVVSAICGLALALLWAAKRGVGGRALPYVSATTDVTAVTVVVVLSGELDALSDASFWPLLLPSYLLVLAGTVLRYDPRLCLYAGAIALVEHELAGLFLAGRGISVDTFAGDARLAFSKAAYLASGALLALVTVRHTLALQRRATHDALTGLANRSYFDQRLAKEHARAERAEEPYALLMIDLDAFKRLNDGAGHAAGDAALRQVAEALQAEFRSSDVVARWGGDEFAAFLPRCDGPAIRPRLERLCARVADTELEGAGGARAPTLSVGVASYPADGTTLEEVWAAADRRVYQSKESGGNAVVGPTPASPRAPAQAADLARPHALG